MSFKTTLTQHSGLVRQTTDYSNGYRMTAAGIPASMSGKPHPRSIAGFDELEVALFGPDGRFISHRNANVPEWLDPVFAELDENIDGEVFRWISRDTARWIHEELKDRAGRWFLTRIADTLIESVR